MSSVENIFGKTRCVIQTKACIPPMSDAAYIATLIVVDKNTSELHPIGDGGTKVELPADTENAAITRASRYLEGRFGSRSGDGQPFLSSPMITSRLYDLWCLPALEPIHRDQRVVFSENGAQGDAPGAGARSSHEKSGKALWDMSQGSRGWIREIGGE